MTQTMIITKATIIKTETTADISGTLIVESVLVIVVPVLFDGDTVLTINNSNAILKTFTNLQSQLVLQLVLHHSIAIH